MMNDTTLPKTLWSETLLEMLYVSLDKQRPDREILKLLMDLRSKGFRASYIVEKVNEEIGPGSIPRLKTLIKRLKKELT